MYLRGVANRAIQAVRKDESVTIRASTGFTMGAGLKQVPSYAADLPALAQLQALTGDDLKQLEGLNVQGTLLSCYVDGMLKAVERPSGKGGDIVVRADSTLWLVVHVFENWGDWTRAAICLQS